ncbi:MAG: hypothetical protein PHY29_07475 [Syntrophales bacterium]|jgi:hypothetical protein|nr:hypothetical protein [Syntrophales bacterium]
MSKISKKKKEQQEGKDERVLTPGGWRPKSKVRHIAPGQRIDVVEGRLKIVDTATGKVIEDLGEIPEVASGPEKRDSGTDRRGEEQKQTRKK